MATNCEHVDYDYRCLCDDKCAYQKPGVVFGVVCKPPKGVNPTFYSVDDWNKTEEEMSAKSLLFHKSEEELETEKKLRIWAKKMEQFKH